MRTIKISTLLQSFGIISTSVGCFLFSIALGFLVTGAAVVVVGVALEREKK